MRRKVRKFLTLFMALVMFASLVCSREMSAFAEDVGTTEQNVFETEESVAEETDFPEETWDDQMDSVAETDEFIPQETESFVETEILEQTIRAGVYGNDASITLSGKMPEGAVAEAYPVQVEIEGQNVLAAYDITIYDAESNVFQPEAGAIRVEIADAAVTEALDGEEDISVYHMENADAQPQQIEEVNTQNQVVAFDAESFSIYVVTMPETHYTCTYDFYDGDTLVNTQILSAGETLIEPKTPNNGEHQIFDGWYTEDGVKFTGFGEFQETLASSRIIKLYARYKETYYVFYKASTAENSKVLYTQTYANGAAILTSDVPFNTGDVNKALIGWSTNPEATLPEQNLTIKGGDVTLYPVIKEAHWITDSNLNHTGIYLYSKGKIMIHLTFDYKTDEKCTTPGQYLKYHRTFQGLSTRELAEKVGIVPATLVLYENDRHPIKYSTAVALANVLGIDRNRLLDEYTAFVDYPYFSLLKKVRQDLSLTQIQMAELIGIGQTSYSGWEREIRVPRRKEYDKILAALKKLRVNVDTYLCQSASI